MPDARRIADAEGLPIADVLDPLVVALRDRGRAVLQAPPGAGKTTIVPLALLDQPWRHGGRVLVLEPRRLAVRAAATRMARLLDERPGGTVGWRMRHDTKVSTDTEIEVVTEGVLTRWLQRDPGLDGVAAVVFDEFHERSLDADLGLTLTLEVLDALRPDLRVLVMSATLDAEPVARLLDAPVVTTEGRMHPVDLVHLDVDRRAPVAPGVDQAVRRALAEQAGDVLVFLPGAAEIDQVRRALAVPGDVDVHALHGRLPPDVQDAAIAPARDGRRKVVLATSIAETSLTIEGVTAVVDAGWRRTPRLDAGSGMTRLVTLPVTRAEADQRAGRAGRLGPGVAYRLWSRAEHATLRAAPEPEIEVTDLCGLALELAAWGADERDLTWPTPPPAGHLAAARELLLALGALDADGTITAHGRSVADLPLHPRLGHLLVAGTAHSHAALAADVAAVLAEGGLRVRGTDLADHLRALRDPAPVERRAAERARTDAARFRRLVGAGGTPGDADDGALGLVAGLGFPDRIGRRRDDQRGEFLLAGGRGAWVEPTDVLAAAEYLCAVELDGRATRARVFLGAPLTETDVRAVAGTALVEDREVRWDRRRGDVVARSVERFGAIVLASSPATDAADQHFTGALLDGVRDVGLRLLGWDEAVQDLQARLQFLHRLDPERWPDVSDDALLADAEIRIAPFVHGARRVRDLLAVDGREVLRHGLDWADRNAIDELAPERLAVPSGNRHRVDYTTDPPVLAVKLQELFGSTETPTVGGGRVPVVLHLLSPAGRPLQVTQDLASFWSDGYAAVRAEMRGRYPKHPWPEDPRRAEPTARTTRRRR